MSYQPLLLTRRNWLAESAAFSNSSNWIALSNIVDPSLGGASAASTDSAVTWFSVDLGASRKIGLLHFSSLLTTSSGRMRVACGDDPTFVSTAFDSGIVSSWPQRSDPLDLTPWNEWTFSGIMDYREYPLLNFVRFFPTGSVSGRYVLVQISDITAAQPVSIGTFGAWETWDLGNVDSEWTLLPVDQSSFTTTAYGSTFTAKRSRSRSIEIAFNKISQNVLLERALLVATERGRSKPLVLLPNPDDTPNLERTGIYGIAEQIDFASPFYGLYDFAFKISELP